ncbi:MAG: hypothetical protein VYE40_00005 [Myxococcota bacterium]|nr:hypothetical protein [Myxococcota bacterium]
MSQVDDIIGMIKADAIDMDALEEAMDAASHDERMAVLRTLTPKLQRRLFDAAEGRKVTLEQIVPSGKDRLEEVIHEGQNTLPAFRHFQKRFCRPSDANAPDDRDVLWGYNHQTMSGFTGPGYFVAYDDEEAGEVCIDYRELPPEHPDAWPEIISNKAKLGFLVYAGMVDRLRRVSRDVTIGRAYKNKPMNAWFALVRKP